LTTLRVECAPPKTASVLSPLSCAGSFAPSGRQYPARRARSAAGTGGVRALSFSMWKCDAVAARWRKSGGEAHTWLPDTSAVWVQI